MYIYMFICIKFIHVHMFINLKHSFLVLYDMHTTRLKCFKVSRLLYMNTFTHRFTHIYKFVMSIHISIKASNLYFYKYVNHTRLLQMLYFEIHYARYLTIIKLGLRVIHKLFVNGFWVRRYYSLAEFNYLACPTLL